MNKFVAEHPEKRYNVIGTAALVDKMKVWYNTEKYFLFYVIKLKDLCKLKLCISMTRLMANL